jgi:hypothetical protein
MNTGVWYDPFKFFFFRRAKTPASRKICSTSFWFVRLLMSSSTRRDWLRLETENLTGHMQCFEPSKTKKSRSKRLSTGMLECAARLGL